jgi:hypothetical protein
VNGYQQEGFAPFDRNVHWGRRLSAAGAYLHPVMRPPVRETSAQNQLSQSAHRPERR